MQPPAPTPSFAKPWENALIPSNFEFSNFGLITNTGISVIWEMEKTLIWERVKAGGEGDDRGLGG